MLTLLICRCLELEISSEAHTRASHQDFAWSVEKDDHLLISQLLASLPRAWANTARKPLGTSGSCWEPAGVVNPPRPHTPVYFRCLPDFQVPLTISSPPYSQSQTWLLTVHFSLSSLTASAFPSLWPEPAHCKPLLQNASDPILPQLKCNSPQGQHFFFLFWRFTFIYAFGCAEVLVVPLAIFNLCCGMHD